MSHIFLPEIHPAGNPFNTSDIRQAIKAVAGLFSRMVWCLYDFVRQWNMSLLFNVHGEEGKMERQSFRTRLEIRSYFFWGLYALMTTEERRYFWGKEMLSAIGSGQGAASQGTPAVPEKGAVNVSPIRECVR